MPAKKRILSVCVQLFLEKGYQKTTLAEIIEKAAVPYSTFQNNFHTKDGVLPALAKSMFADRLGMARETVGADVPPVCLYAVETAVQLTLAELHENLREIYMECYDQSETAAYLEKAAAKETYQIFGPYQPKLKEHDFCDMAIGTAGIMRGYMAHPCNESLTLEKKLRLFLSIVLRSYRVPEQEIRQALDYLAATDIRAVAQHIMEKRFQALEAQYDFHLDHTPYDKKEERT